MGRIKILLFASNPEETSHLKLDEEVRAITEKIRAAEYRDGLELISWWAVRPDDLLQALNVHKPAIVHFSGHGSKTGEIILMDDNRQIKPVSTAALTSLLSTFKESTRLVILNSCYSQTQAAAIADVIDFVIGMSTSIGDDAAIKFSASFYRAIGFGQSVQRAFEQGQAGLLLEGIPEATTPQLHVRGGVNASEVVLIDPIHLLSRSRGGPADLALEVDKISNFEMIKSNAKTIYTIAGEHQGTTVYGRGQRLLICLTNKCSTGLTISSLRLRIVAKAADYPKTLRYSRMEMTVPHNRLPIEAIRAPIYLDDTDAPQGVKDIGEGRIFLGPTGSSDAIHQIACAVEARSPGLWTYQLEAEFTDTLTNRQMTQICRDIFMILLRGR